MIMISIDDMYEDMTCNVSVHYFCLQIHVHSQKKQEQFEFILFHDTTSQEEHSESRTTSLIVKVARYSFLRQHGTHS